jgi:cell division protein FtsB
MSFSTTPVTARSAAPRRFGVRSALILLAIAVGVAWSAYGYAQEAYLSHKLSQQVSDLRHQNSVLAAQNQGYTKDIKAITSGAANEEEARMNGYSRPNEKVFLITAPPSPTPATPAPTPSPSAH